ncbi:WS/DGAT domain-containing protein [Mycobacterium lepromatosis]|uniref:WS/DGAT domain-containing protein n=2 Tax=Mycobacterium lepromatosis TaxID=480418 RepID=UPI00067873F6
MGPLGPWSAFTMTAWRYIDQLNLSVLTDDAIVQDPHEMSEALNVEFIQILRSGALPKEFTVM